MKVDIVVPLYNLHHITDRCLNSIPESFPSDQVFVIDDGSTPPYTHPRFKVLRHQTNLGPHAAWNTGWRAGSSDLVLFVNNDIEFLEPDTIGKFVAEMNQHPDMTYLGGWEVNSKVLGPVPDRTYYRAHYNSCFITRRSLLERLEGFDSRMRLVYSDIDFIYRMEALGGQRLVARHIPVYHGKSMSRKATKLEDDVMQEFCDQEVFFTKWAGNSVAESENPRLDYGTKLKHAAEFRKLGEQL